MTETALPTTSFAENAGMTVQEVVVLKEQKYHLYLSDDEYKQVIQNLVSLKNSLTTQGRYTDGVDDVLCKELSAKK